MKIGSKGDKWPEIYYLCVKNQIIYHEMPRYRCLIFLICSFICQIAFSDQTNGERVMRYDDRDGLSNSLVGGGIQDRNGLLWFATWNGLNCYDGYEFHWVKINPGDSAPIGTNHIRDILLSDCGNIICHTDDDIYEFDLNEYAFRDIPDVKKDSLRNLVGKNWEGLTDLQGNRWTADPTGLYKRFSPHHPATLLPGTDKAHPRAFMIDANGNLWVGSRAWRGIKVYAPDGKVDKTIHLETTPYCIFQASNGDVWIGGKPGALMKIGGESISDEAVYDIKEDRHGRLWVATFGGGIKCCPDPNADEPELSASLGGTKVRKLLITPSDNLIAATTSGLLIGHIDSLDFSRTTMRAIKRDGNNPASLSSNATMSVARDSNGHIFIATESSGVDMINEDDLFSDNPEFTHFNMRNSSLASDVCNAIALASDSLLFIAGSDNVMALNHLTGRTVNLSTAYWGDSCHFSEATPIMLPDSSWIFGADEGAFVTSMNDISRRDHIPPVVFTTLAINGGNAEFCLAPRRRISLRPDERNVSIYFAAIDYIDNGDILYRTRLDESPWTQTERTRGVTLFNLSPGEHILEVQSTDRYGRWVDNTRQLSITVSPYWFETWWAKTIMAILCICILSAIACTYIYIRRVNRHRRELLEKYMALLKGNEASAETESTPDETPEETRPPTARQKPEETAFLNRVRKYIEDNLSNPDANVDAMAEAAAASRSTLNRHLRSQLGISAAQLLIEARMQRAKQLLETDEDDSFSIMDVAQQCGYSDPQYFQRVFKKKHGRSPGEYRETARRGTCTPL